MLFLERRKEVITTGFFNVDKNTIQSVIKQIQQLVFYLLAKPRLEDTEEARSFERYRRCAWTSVVMMAMRGSNILIGIVSVPMTLNYLGSDLFGVWMILTSIIGFASFTDFGMGLGLRNSIIKSAANKDYESIRLYIWNAISVLTIVATVIIGLVLLVLPLIPLDKLIKTSTPETAGIISTALGGMLIVFAISLPTHQLLNIASGLQRAYWGYGVYLIGRVLSFVFICLCVHFRWSFTMLTIGYLGTPTVCIMLAWIVFFLKAPLYIPRPGKLNKRILKDLFGIGVYSLLHNMAFAILNSSTIVLIGHTICAEASVPFSVTQKMFSLPSVFSAALLMGLNVAIGDAWHQHNIKWIDEAIRRSNRLIWPVVTLAALVFILFGKWLIILWTHNDDALPTMVLLIICGIKCVVDIYASFFSGFLIGINHVKEVAIYQLTCGCIAIVAGYLIGILTQNATWVVFSSLLGALPCAICYHIRFRNLLKQYRTNNTTVL